VYQESLQQPLHGVGRSRTCLHHTSSTALHRDRPCNAIHRGHRTATPPSAISWRRPTLPHRAWPDHNATCRTPEVVHSFADGRVGRTRAQRGAVATGDECAADRRRRPTAAGPVRRCDPSVRNRPAKAAQSTTARASQSITDPTATIDGRGVGRSSAEYGMHAIVE
jgi:hypothetical protein